MKPAVMNATRTFHGTCEEVYEFLIFFHLGGAHWPDLFSSGRLDATQTKKLYERVNAVPVDWRYPKKLIIEARSAPMIIQWAYGISADGESATVNCSHRLRAGSIFGKIAENSFKKAARRGDHAVAGQFLSRLQRDFDTREHSGVGEAFNEFRRESGRL